MIATVIATICAIATIIRRRTSTCDTASIGLY